jgi:electron transfer flavoprotein alpha subunit
VHLTIVLFTDGQTDDDLRKTGAMLNQACFADSLVTCMTIGAARPSERLPDYVPADRLIHLSTERKPIFDDDHDVAQALSEQCRHEPPEMILFEDTCFAVQVAVRLSRRLGIPFYNRVVALDRSADEYILKRSEYSGNLVTAYRIKRQPMILIPVPLAFSQAAQVQALTARGKAVTTEESTVVLTGRLRAEQTYETGTASLKNAQIVLAIGQGVGSKKDVEHLIAWAKEERIEYGATRPIVLNGWVSSDKMIGSSGVSIAPELLIAVGISGSGAFLAGAQYAHKIIAINKDPNANIFQHADIGYVCGWEAVFK